MLRLPEKASRANRCAAAEGETERRWKRRADGAEGRAEAEGEETGGARAALVRVPFLVDVRESGDPGDEAKAGVSTRSSGGKCRWATLPTKVPRGECSRMENDASGLAEVMECVEVAMRRRATNELAISIINY